MSNNPNRERPESSRSTGKEAQPSHVPGTNKGEEQALTTKEPGRGSDRKSYQDARDSTGINSDKRQPIHPSMPQIPPA